MSKTRRTTIGHNPLDENDPDWTDSDPIPESGAAADAPAIEGAPVSAAADPIADQAIVEQAMATYVVEPADEALDMPKGGLRARVTRGYEAVADYASSTKNAICQRVWRRSARDRSLDAIGGKLELLGGELGNKFALIQRYGEARRIGFHAADGTFIDLQDQLETLTSRQDRSDFRKIEAIGWAGAAAALIGPPGAVLGGGIRLLHPTRMICEARLRDGRGFVARTDSVTMAGLTAMAHGGETAAQASRPTAEARSPHAG
jgi:hypothetical protein